MTKTFILNWIKNLLNGFFRLRKKEVYPPLVQKARKFAIRAHRRTNHKYGSVPYDYHLNDCYQIAKRFIALIPEKYREQVLAAIWLHDCIEDCRLTYNDIKKEFGEFVAELVFAVTNEKGKTRKDRANDKYYKGIVSTPYATFVKLCDRIANIENSKKKKHGMYDGYLREMPYFIRAIYNEHYQPMFEYLKTV